MQLINCIKKSFLFDIIYGSYTLLEQCMINQDLTYLCQLVDLHIEQSHLTARLGVVHDAAGLLSCVDDGSQCCARRYHTVCPQRVLYVQAFFSTAIMLEQDKTFLLSLQYRTPTVREQWVTKICSCLKQNLDYLKIKENIFKRKQLLMCKFFMTTN